ncbi:hypothetical protein IFM89_024214 [Coptis chinensis]|uniref:Uncharacterized protein n=1 Tax=Coptis chinensis TaxID=261450 RepID=A0A835H785_9MAGN|nr:hypothetical protein IFM89_024214 [Coptis chinensis]
MGCITSKLMTRSGSFQEELSRSLQRRHNDFPGLEELLISNSKNDDDDQFLVVCNENNAKQPSEMPSESVMDFKTSENNSKPFDEELLNSETINTWDLMSDLDEEEKEEDAKREHDHHELLRAVNGSTDITKRSKSFIWSSADHESSIGETSASISIRSKSFHTLHKYNALIMEKKVWPTPKAAWYWEDRLDNFLTSITNEQTPYHSINLSKKGSVDAEDKGEMVQELQVKSHIQRDAEEMRTLALRADNHENKEMGIKDICIQPSPTNGLSVGADHVTFIKRSIADDDEKGASRKAWAKGLTSLTIPSANDEFPVVASMKGWIDDTEVNKGQLLLQHCPAEDYTYYVTPKFGSSGLPLLTNRKKCIEEESLFDPKLVSSFEVAMEQLQVEEKFLLKQITEKF